MVPRAARRRRVVLPTRLPLVVIRPVGGVGSGRGWSGSENRHSVNLGTPANASYNQALRGDLKGRYSIRVNDQYRVTFRWENGHAFEVAAEDYH